MADCMTRHELNAEINKSAAMYRIKSVPLVCSKWHEMMADASMWPVVDVTPRGHGTFYYFSSHGDITYMDVWLRRRSAGMRELTLRACAQSCSNAIA